MLDIRVCGHVDLEKYYTMFEVDFDSEELLPKLAVHKAITNRNAELLGFYDTESKLDLGYALVITKNVYGYVLLKYFGIFPWYRGKGLGVEAMRLLNKRYADRQGIAAEITEFDDPAPDHVKRLLKFFDRFGYRETETKYKIRGTNTHLMVKPVNGPGDIGPVAERIMRDFYSRVLSATAVDRMISFK